MKISYNQKKDLIRRISIIQYSLGRIIENIDDSQSAASIGEILRNLSFLIDAINNSATLEDEEIWF